MFQQCYDTNRVVFQHRTLVSLQLMKTDTTTSVIQNALEKYCLDGAKPCDYNLFQVLSDNREWRGSGRG